MDQVKSLQSQVAELQGKLNSVRSENERRLELSAERKEQTQRQLVEQLKELGEDTVAKQKRIDQVEAVSIIF